MARRKSHVGVAGACLGRSRPPPPRRVRLSQLPAPPPHTTHHHVLAAAAASVPNSTRSKDLDQKTVQAAPPPTCGGQRRVSPSYLRRAAARESLPAASRVLRRVQQPVAAATLTMTACAGQPLSARGPLRQPSVRRRADATAPTTAPPTAPISGSVGGGRLTRSASAGSAAPSITRPMPTTTKLKTTHERRTCPSTSFTGDSR